MRDLLDGKDTLRSRMMSVLAVVNGPPQFQYETDNRSGRGETPIPGVTDENMDQPALLLGDEGQGASCGTENC